MYRIGQSTDIHRFCEGNFITLAGVKIEADFGVEAHSDGDALCHAVAESILGALALQDLGTHFPDTSDENKGRSSIEILKEVVKMMVNRGYEIQNMDSLILIEQPKMALHIEQMCKNMQKVLDTDIQNINIKATRGEKIGLVGRGEGLVAQCVVLLRRKI